MATPQIVSLQRAKNQLRLSGNAEDDKIETYIASAGLYIQKVLNLDTIDDIPGIGDSPNTVPEDIQEAALMLITASYENPSAQVIGQTITPNEAVMNKLYPYRTDIGI